jgi:hypothetical protein
MKRARVTGAMLRIAGDYGIYIYILLILKLASTIESYKAECDPQEKGLSLKYCTTNIQYTIADL